ncbi:MAG: ABC transporter permease [Bacteroidota bacterium]
MFAAIGRAFNEAFHSLRSNFFQTILSVLGIIIGVGALVAMLSLIDGLEALARNKIAERTSLENVQVISRERLKMDDVWVDKDTVARLDIATMQDLLAELPVDGRAQLTARATETMQHPTLDSLIGVRKVAVSLPFIEADLFTLIAGRTLTDGDQAAVRPVAMVNKRFAQRLVGEQDSVDQVVGQQLAFKEDTVEIVGVVEGDIPGLTAIMPLSLFEERGNPPIPQLIFAIDNVDETSEAKDFITEWLEERYAHIDQAFEIHSSEFWLKQLEEGFLVFRLVMSLIVGIAVIVGGVGVMNVLLMSITARTAEIGVRKAVGAGRKHIITQFLSESIAVSLIGSAFGVLLGIVMSMVAAPIMSMFAPDLTFHPVFTVRTLITVAILAVIVGIVFGTYPARRAAGLDPVEAIRKT